MHLLSRFSAAKVALLLLISLSAGRVGYAQIVNGSFETGDLSGWTRAGFLSNNQPSGTPSNFAAFLATQVGASSVADSNAAVTSQTTSFDGGSGPAILPTNGSFLAFISSESAAGNGTLTGSSLSQTFVIPASAGLLRFDVALLSNDFNAGDFGGVALSQAGTTLQEFNIATLAGQGDVTVTNGNSQGGFAASSGFLNQTFDVSGLRGQTVTLTAYVTDAVDSTVESRLLLDNVNITTVPEPGALLLVAAGLAPVAGRAAVLRRRRRSR